MNPKVSVVMPVYNAEPYLAEAIDSILTQTFGDFELIIIDDASTDGSLEMARHYALRDPRVVLLENEKNLGVSGTKNRALRIARGKYIAIMDADDVSFPDRFEIEYGYLESRPDIYLVGGSFEYVAKKGAVINVHPVDFDQRHLKKIVLEKDYVIRQSSIMFRNEGAVFYDEFLRVAEDKDLYIRLLAEGRSMAVIPHFLVKYRVHSESLSSNHMNLQKLIAGAISVNSPSERLHSFNDAPELDPAYVAKLREIWAAYGEKRPNRRYLLKQVMTAPLKYKAISGAYLCASFFPKEFVNACSRRLKKIKSGSF